MTGRLCQCGCGETTSPGRTWRRGHSSALRRRQTPREIEYVRCPRCGQTVAVRDDGTLGAHWSTKRKVKERSRCAEAGQPRPTTPRKLRRVTVEVDVVLPLGWSKKQFQAELAALLQARLDEPFVIQAHVRDADEVAS